MRKHNDIQYDKIIDILKTTKLEDIKIEILEKNISLDILDSKLIKHLNYYNKDVLLNYNDDYYVKPDDLKKVTGLMYSMKHRR